MLKTLPVLLLASVPCSLAAFSNTFSLLAYSDDAGANLESFRPFAGKGSQDYQISLAEASGEPCIPTLIVSAPSFSYDDLALLPASSTLRQGWTDAQAQLHFPYLGKPSADNLRYLINRRQAKCDPSQTTFRRTQPFSKRTLDEKVRWVQQLDMLVERNLEKLSEPHIVIISSVPDLGQHYRMKRQFSDSEWEQIEAEVSETEEEATDIGSRPQIDVVESEESDSPSSQVLAPTKPLSVFEQDGNSNNNATVDSHGSLFQRYSFTSPALLFATIITVLVLIPTVLFAINALTSIESLQGLDSGKMVGGQLADTKKDQ